jgi:hypothetical protein
MRGDLEARAVIGERALHRGVAGDDGAAGRGDDGAEDGRAEGYERGTVSPDIACKISVRMR